MVIWLIGMSASGKTTIGQLLHQKLKQSDSRPWFFLDGDVMRHLMGEDLGHRIEDREKNAYRISRFCQLLESQGINVIACVLSIFHDNQRYNRSTFKDYREVYIEVDFEILKARDNKQLYQQALAGKIDNVVGVDIEFPRPFAPDLVIDNSSAGDIAEKVDQIISSFDLGAEVHYPYGDRNLLKSPEKYQYTKYLGKGYYRAYDCNRQQALERINARIGRLPGYLQNCDNHNHWLCQQFQLAPSLSPYLECDLAALDDGSDERASAPGSQQSVLEWLSDLLQKTSLTEPQMQSLLILVQRFEVSKRLFWTYHLPSLRRKGDLVESLLVYQLFGLLLCRSIEQYQGQPRALILTNALLKLMDLLVSVQGELTLVSELYLMRELLQREQQVISVLKGED